MLLIMSSIVLLLVLHTLLSADGFLNPFPKHNIKVRQKNLYYDEDTGSPLFLTPLIESGNIEKARDLARVDFPGFPEVKSYAGFFTVNKTYDSNQFLWYFPPMGENKNMFVLLWLQGGPGSSSLFGLFDENGPFEVINGTFHQRGRHWARYNHIIYIDNPVGAGFSFTNDSRGYCSDQTQVGEHLHTTLTQFFQMFPELQKYQFFVNGESYAGKYATALAYTVHKKNSTAKTNINLKGVIIGNGWCDPISMVRSSDYLYQLGLIDWDLKSRAEVLQNQTVELIKKEAWKAALKSFDQTLNLLKNFIGSVSVYNYVKSDSDPHCNFCDLLTNASMRKALHVGNLEYDFKSNIVYNNLAEDIMKSVAPWISELLEHYYMLFYNGQLDTLVPYPLTVDFLRELKFSGRDAYLNAKREKMFLDIDSVAVQIGYMKIGKTLSDLLVRNAGHMVPVDQPEWIYFATVLWRYYINNNITSFDEVHRLESLI